MEAVSNEEEKEKRAFNSFNSKRADFLIANWKREPVAVIEYHGSGHGTDEKTLKRDKVKQLTLEKAGVPLIVIRPERLCLIKFRRCFPEKINAWVKNEIVRWSSPHFVLCPAKWGLLHQGLDIKSKNCRT